MSQSREGGEMKALARSTGEKGASKRRLWGKIVKPAKRCHRWFPSRVLAKERRVRGGEAGTR